MTPERRAAAIAATVGGALMILGAFLPWLNGSGFGFNVSRSGIDLSGDAPIFVIGGLLLTTLGVTLLTGRLVPHGVVVLSAVGAALMGIVWLYSRDQVSGRVDELNGDPGLLASIGIGVWVVGLGVLVSTAALVVWIVNKTDDVVLPPQGTSEA